MSSQTNAGWVIDLEDRTPLKTSVAPEKYLRVTGSLKLPENGGVKNTKIGCLNVELKDNVNYPLGHLYYRLRPGERDLFK